MTRKPRASVFDAALIMPAIDEVTAAKPAKSRAVAKVETTSQPAKGEEEMFRTSLYLSRSTHDRLREIAFHEKKKIHDLIREGLDSVLNARGYAPTSENIKA